jgi:hypothetical protein
MQVAAKNILFSLHPVSLKISVRRRKSPNIPPVRKSSDTWLTFSIALTGSQLKNANTKIKC